MTVSKHPHSPRLWIILDANGQRAARHHHFQTRREAQEYADWLSAIA